MSVYTLGPAGTAMTKAEMGLPEKRLANNIFNLPFLSVVKNGQS